MLYILSFIGGVLVTLLCSYYQATRAKTKALADKLGEAIDKVKS